MILFARTMDKLHESVYNFERIRHGIYLIKNLNDAKELSKTVRTFRFDFYSFAKAIVEVRNTLMNELTELTSKQKCKNWFSVEFSMIELNPFWQIIYSLRNVSVHEGNRTPFFKFSTINSKGIAKFTFDYSGRSEDELIPEIELIPRQPIHFGKYAARKSEKLSLEEEDELIHTATALANEFRGVMTKNCPWKLCSVNFQDDVELSCDTFLDNCLQLVAGFNKLVEKTKIDFKHAYVKVT